MENNFLDYNLIDQLDRDEIIKSATLLDEGIQETVQNAPLTHAEIIRNATIIDEGIKLCPLCRNEVRLFFINLNEKILMCENYDCDFPFGHEDIIYVKENDSIETNEEVSSIVSRPTYGSLTYGSRSKTQSATCSVISTAAWLDIDKMNKINETENQNDHRTEQREYYRHKKEFKEKNLRKLEENKKIMKKVEAIVKINEELKTYNCIKNEKWIKNLMNKQKTSGLSLLKPEEMSMFKQKKPDFGLGELKIDINREPVSSTSNSAIKIQICNLKTDKEA